MAININTPIRGVEVRYNFSGIPEWLSYSSDEDPRQAGGFSC